MRSTSSPNSLALQRKQMKCLHVRQRKKEDGQDIFVMNTWISYICDSSLVMHLYEWLFFLINCFAHRRHGACPCWHQRVLKDTERKPLGLLFLKVTHTTMSFTVQNFRPPHKWKDWSNYDNCCEQLLLDLAVAGSKLPSLNKSWSPTPLLLLRWATGSILKSSPLWWIK
jgi:hypothetical protein